MINSYSSLCDDFYLDMYINTKLKLPTERDTVLAFFERIQKQFPSMSCFYRRENKEHCLEEDRGDGQYRWITLHSDHIGSGAVNPSDLEQAYSQNKLVLELAPYMLSLSNLDIDSLDVMFGMDFDCPGSGDEIIAEALFANNAFGCLLDLPQAKPVNFCPAVVVALSDDGRTQGRLSIESKSSVYESGEKKQIEQDIISLCFTVRYYPTGGKFDAIESFEHQCELAEELMAERIVANFVKPLTDIIAEKRLTKFQEGT